MSERILTLTHATVTQLYERARAAPWPEPVQRAGQRVAETLATLRARLSPRPRPAPRADDAPAPRHAPKRRPSSMPAPRPAPIVVEPLVEVASGDVATIVRLVESLETSPSYEVRAQAARSLGAFRGMEVIEALCEAIRDESAEVAIAAVSALGRQDGERATLALEDAVRATDFLSPLTRVGAIEALIAQDAAKTELLALVARDLDVTVSLAAIDAIARVAPSEDTLSALLGDRSGYFAPDVRIAIARTIARLDADQAVALALYETDEAVRAVLLGAS